jgi:hypothetical protein
MNMEISEARYKLLAHLRERLRCIDQALRALEYLQRCRQNGANPPKKN